MKTCDECGGSGSVDCPDCDADEDGCDTCYDHGEVECECCEGSGEVEENEDDEDE